MGLGSFLKEIVKPVKKGLDIVPGLDADLVGKPGDFVRDELLGGKEAKKAAQQVIDSARNSADLFKGFADVLRSDIAPLKELRDRNLTSLFDVIQGGGEFEDSAEFNTVLDAANAVVNRAPNPLRGFLSDRAESLAQGQFRPFANRIATQAGVGSQGLNTTNRLLQSNVGAQSGILNQAGQTAADTILGQNRAAAQTATGILGLLGTMFSDERLKKNIEKVGQLDNGVNVYQWDWKDEKYNHLPTVGVIAQEVQKQIPEAVEEVDGILRVDIFKATGVDSGLIN